MLLHSPPLAYTWEVMWRRLATLLIGLCISADGMWISQPGADSAVNENAAMMCLVHHGDSVYCPMHNGPDQSCTCQISGTSQTTLTSSVPAITEELIGVSANTESTPLHPAFKQKSASTMIEHPAPPPKVD